MKKGYLYLVVSNEEIDGLVHYHEAGELVECTGIEETGSGRMQDEDGTGQYLRSGHVVEIGKI